MGQSGGASRWRVCYQRGLPRLVFFSSVTFLSPCLSTFLRLSVQQNIYAPRNGLGDRPRGLDSWTVPAWSLKNKELFFIGPVDRPRVEPYKGGGIQDWTCGPSTRIGLVDRPCVEPYKQGVVPAWTRGSSTHGQSGVPQVPPWGSHQYQHLKFALTLDP